MLRGELATESVILLHWVLLPKRNKSKRPLLMSRVINMITNSPLKIRLNTLNIRRTTIRINKTNMELM